MSTQCFEWRGGAFHPGASVPLADRGFRYGMAVFETILVRDGQPEFFDAHIQRLRAACFSAGFVLDETAIAGVPSQLPEDDSIVRIFVTAGPGRFDSRSREPAHFLMIEPRSPVPEAAYERGYALHDAFHRVAPPLPGIKTCNYWPNILALDFAHSHNCDECLLMNSDGGIVSAAMANVFLVLGGELITPAVECGARPGVVREWVIERRAVTERSIRLDDVQSANEIFLTSTGLGIMQVSRVGERPLPSREVARKLMKEFEDHAGRPAR